MRPPVIERVKAGFASLLESVFQERELPFFKGGSRRFGYHHHGSDTDFFVLCEDRLSAKDLLGDLEEIGFSVEPGNPQYSSLEGLHYLVTLPGLFHVAILLDEDHFMDFRVRHDKVETLVVEQPYLRQVARKLREQGEKGSRIFTLLYELAVDDSAAS